MSQSFMRRGFLTYLDEAAEDHDLDNATTEINEIPND
jgi:hypothetical protein